MSRLLRHISSIESGKYSIPQCAARRYRSRATEVIVDTDRLSDGFVLLRLLFSLDQKPSIACLIFDLILISLVSE